MRNRGWRGREAGVEGAGSLERLEREFDFFYRKFKENGSLRPIGGFIVTYFRFYK